MSLLKEIPRPLLKEQPSRKKLLHKLYLSIKMLGVFVMRTFDIHFNLMTSYCSHIIFLK